MITGTWSTPTASVQLIPSFQQLHQLSLVHSPCLEPGPSSSSTRFPNYIFLSLIFSTESDINISSPYIYTFLTNNNWLSTDYSISYICVGVYIHNIGSWGSINRGDLPGIQGKCSYNMEFSLRILWSFLSQSHSSTNPHFWSRYLLRPALPHFFLQALQQIWCTSWLL